MGRPKSESTMDVSYNCRIDNTMEDELYRLSRKVGVPRSRILRMACRMGLAHVSRLALKANMKIMKQIKDGRIDLGSVNRELEREVENLLNNEMHKMIVQEDNKK